MGELLKDRYNELSLRELAARFEAACPAFPDEAFVAGIMDEPWAELGLKQRMRRVTLQLGACLPAEYEQALGVIDEVAAGYPAEFSGFALMCFPDFVEVYGQDERNWDASMAALERYTPLASAEFAVRPFIVKHEERMMAQMAAWAASDSEHVRRLASEGCRPRLPWGRALESFKRDPSPVLGILERLKADPSPYVRTSVANNLNDIAKTHPDLVLGIARDWLGEDERTDWIVKRGCRTLLKQSNREALALFGFDDAECARVEGFSLDAAVVPIGGALGFSFVVEATKPINVRLEYAIDYVKARGVRSRKVFQIAEFALRGAGRKSYAKTHSFADLSTRRHYPGIHAITLIANGVERGTLEFEVVEPDARSSE